MKILIKLIIFLLSVIYVFYTVDFDMLIKNILSYDKWAIVYIILLNIVSLFFMAYRFILLFNKISFKQSLRIITLSMGINQIAPVKGGDFVRPFMVKKVIKTKLSYLFAILTIERFLDIFTLSLLVMLILKISTSYLMTISVFFIIILIIFRKGNIKKIISILKTIKYKKIRNFLLRFYITLIKFNKKTLFKVFLFTVFMYVVYVVAMFLFLEFFTTFNLSFFQTLVVFVISTVGVLIPSAPASLGTYEASVVFALGIYNITKEDALSFAIVYHFIQIFIILSLSGIFLLKDKYE